MKEAPVKAVAKTRPFVEWIRARAALMGKSFRDCMGDQGRLAAADLMKHTPPFSGRNVAKMIDARGASRRDLEIEKMSALAVGKRRVELDIRRVIYGIEGPGLSLSKRHKSVTGGTSAVDIGVMQKCEGKQAIRVFSKKDGTIYGIDYAEYLANANPSSLDKFLQSQRDSRGRVTKAAAKDRRIGRWRFLSVKVVPEKVLSDFIRMVQERVGEARGGWADGFMRLGGVLNPTGWVGKHRRAGRCDHNLETADAANGNVRIKFTNESAWASRGDPEGFVKQAIEGRAKAAELDVARRLKELK